MRLTPLDIRKQEFARGFRGYDPEDVNAFLEMMSSQWDELLDDSRRKDERIRELENKMAHYEKVEMALQEALETARETSRKALQNAEDKARLIVDQAEKQAEDIKRNAEQDRHQIKRETAKLSGRRSEIVTRLRAFLMSEMELLARFEGDDPVGFIKLLPAEERRLHQLSSEAHAGDPTEDRDAPSNRPPEATRTTTFAPTPINTSSEDDGSRETDDVYSEPERSEPSYGRSGGEGEDVQYEEEGSEQRPREEVIHGPGWTARTVVSRPPEQAAQRSQDPPDYPDDDPGHEEATEGEPNTRSSTDEIEKIRRILSDLD